MATLEQIWARELGPLAPRSLDILEIGSFEGASAARFLTLLPLSKITCVEPFTGDEFGGESYNGDVSTIESRFDANTARFGSRVRKFKSRSVPALEALRRDNESFDIIYIDGSHVRDDIIVDSLLSWPLLRANGIMIWDDYAGGSDWPAAEKPKKAIDTFLALHPEHELIRVGYQLMARKVARGGALARSWQSLRNGWLRIGRPPRRMFPKIRVRS